MLHKHTRATGVRKPAPMTTFSRLIAAAHKAPRRICITVPDRVHVALQQRSFDEGRSASNLAAFLLEMALAQQSFAKQP